MNSQEMTAMVKQFAKELGADLVGIAPVSRYEGAPEKLRPQAHMPEAKCVVVLAVHHVDGSVNFGGEPNSNYPAGFQIGMIPKLDVMAFRLSRFIEQKLGFRAFPYSCTYYWRHRKQKGIPFDHAASFSNMNAFVAAGLGEYGWHGMVMSPEYGPRQRIVSLFTDAPLLGDPLYRGEPLCDRCRQCEKACWGENYKESALLSPKTIRFEIEGKVFEYANINRWRCFWGEQCHLDMKYLAERSEMDEKMIYKALDAGVPRSINGPAGYMCSSFKYCMAKPLRRWDKKIAPSPLRKKKSPDLPIAELKKQIFHLAEINGADRISIRPMEEFEAMRKNFTEGFRVDDFYRTFRWVVTVGRAMPESMKSDSALAKKNRSPAVSRTIGRLTIATLDMARYLDDEGYEVIQIPFGFAEHSIALESWGNCPDDVLGQCFVTNAPLEKIHLFFHSPGTDGMAVLNPKQKMLEHLDAVGCVNWKDLDPRLGKELRELMPEAKSLIVTAGALPERAVELAGKQEAECGVSYILSVFQALRESFWAAQDLASELQARGHRAMALSEVESASAAMPHPYVGTIADLRAQARFAKHAGLGFVGKNGFLISPDYGQRLRFAFVLTDADLPSSAKMSGECPEGCTLCADACPVHALTIGAGKVFERNEARCEWARVLGLSEGEGGSLGGWNVPDLPVPDTLDDGKRCEAFAQKDPIQIRCYQNPFVAATPIERCLQACPFAGSKKPEII